MKLSKATIEDYESIIAFYPQESNRAEAFSMWMSSPMPMVTLVKTPP